MREKAVELLDIRQSGVYIDATTGSGGHAEAILKKIGPDGRLIGIDRDENALRAAGEKLSDSRVTLVRGNFSDMKNIANACGIASADGVLFDLGASSMQLRDPERGFSFLSDAPLDMRMDRSQRVSAHEIVNLYPENQLEEIFRGFGEERLSRKIARAIIRSRERKPIETCSELAKIVEKVYGMRKRIHPATRTFQALRIAVNRELEQLAAGLQDSLSILKNGGRLCVISYHSLEDRIVKHFMADNAKKGLIRKLTKKPVTPEQWELRMNPSSRSAKMRVGEKT